VIVKKFLALNLCLVSMYVQAADNYVDASKFDIFGFTLGMSEQEVKSRLEKVSGDGFRLTAERVEGYDQTSPGTISIIRTLNKTPDRKWFFPPAGKQIIVHFPLPGTGDTATAVYRFQDFPSENQSLDGMTDSSAPTAEIVEEALVERYGEPTASFKDTTSTVSIRDRYIWTSKSCPLTEGNGLLMQSILGGIAAPSISKMREAVSKAQLNGSCETVLMVEVIRQVPQVVWGIGTGLLNLPAVEAAEIKFSEIAQAYEAEQQKDLDSRRAKPTF